MGKKEPSIRLSNDRGLNPRLTVCIRCGGETPSLALLGDGDYLYDCVACKAKVLGTRGMRKCTACGANTGTLSFDRRLEENEKISMGLCEDCENKDKEAEEVVKAGGIYWRCVDCGSGGAIRAESDIAKEVRKHANIEPPDPVGIEFTKEDNCPVCGPNAQEGT